MIPSQVEILLKKSKFVSIATSNKKGRPNVAPKFLVDIKGDNIYLVDYVINSTWKNLSENPFAAISIANEETLTGYQLKGNAEILSQGREFNRINKLLNQKIHEMSVDRVIEAVRSKRKSESYELLIPAKIVVFKMKVEELFIISPTGTVTKEKLGKIAVSGENPIIKTDLKTETTPLFYPPMIKRLPEGTKINS